MRLRCHLLVGEAAGPAVAQRVAELFCDCPFAHFASAFGVQVVVVWYLPEGHSWWAEGIAHDPQGTLGLERAAVYVAERPAFPREGRLRLPDQPGESAPCGSNCTDCPHWKEPCPGCPASSKYEG